MENNSSNNTMNILEESHIPYKILSVKDLISPNLITWEDNPHFTKKTSTTLFCKCYQATSKTRP